MIKEEEVEDVDGSYACVICSESVRGMAALCCARCSSNPFHASCVDGTGFAEMCPQCAGKTVVAWTGRDAGSAAAAAAAIVIEDAPRDPAPAATPPKEGAFLFSSPSGCCSSLRPDRVRTRARRRRGDCCRNPADGSCRRPGSRRQPCTHGVGLH